jgi:hypothetical protein
MLSRVCPIACYEALFSVPELDDGKSGSEQIERAFRRRFIPCCIVNAMGLLTRASIHGVYQLFLRKKIVRAIFLVY